MATARRYVAAAHTYVAAAHRYVAAAQSQKSTRIVNFEVVQLFGSSMCITTLLLDSQNRTPLIIYCQAQPQLQLYSSWVVLAILPSSASTQLNSTQFQFWLRLALFSTNPPYMLLLRLDMWLLRIHMWLLRTDMWLLHNPEKVPELLIWRLSNYLAVQCASLHCFWTHRIEHH